MFKLQATDGRARAGEMQLAHGSVQTPIFMPVGTVGSVKSLTPADLETMNAQIILGNTYHLFLRPGLEVLRHFGGLHEFIKWDKPILSDSGGFQIFSLSKRRVLSQEGARFRSHLDGSEFFLTPEKAVEIQETFGSDIHMVLDDCTAFPATRDQARDSMELTIAWAKRCRTAKKRADLMQFGIVQGSMFEDLRLECAERLGELNFEGYAVGGLSVGEDKEAMRRITDATTAVLPPDRPRYLMGVGTPLDLIESVALGVDMFDCVMPTRNGRNGYLFTSQGRVSIKNSQYKFDQSPLDPDCPCYTCATFDRGYLRHLYVSKEITAMRLFTLHNLTYYLRFMARIRAAIFSGTFSDLLAEQREIWKK